MKFQGRVFAEIAVIFVCVVFSVGLVDRFGDIKGEIFADGVVDDTTVCARGLSVVSFFVAEVRLGKTM